MRTAALLLIVAAVVLVAAGLEAASPDSGAANEMIIPVQGFRFDGHSAFSSETLAEAVADFAGRGLTFAELEEAAGRITRLYRARGFIVAEAYIPAQVIEADGIVTIAVREGRYGDVVVRNESRLADDVARAALGRVKPGALIEAAPLERVLSLLDELPGVSARGELSSGGEPGTSILTVRLADAGRFAGSLRVDNYGHELTGRARTSFSADVNNVSGYGDRLSVQATAAEGLGHGSLAYSVPLNATPFRLSIGLTASRYVMGGALAELGVEGTTSAWRLGMNYPLKRVAPRPGAAGLFVHRIDGDVAFESRALQDRVGALSGERTAQALQAGIRGSGHAGGGPVEFSVEATWGRLHFADDVERLLDTLTAKTEGEYAKVSVEATHRRRIGRSLSFEVAMRAQWASKNLHSSEKMALGGAQGVRGYGAGEAPGDLGALIRLELEGSLYRQAWRWTAFADGGWVRRNLAPWEEGVNDRSLYGAGLGLIYAPSERFEARVGYAVPLGAEEPGAGRLWAAAGLRW